MSGKCQIKRGPESTRSAQRIAAGEIIVTTDEHKLYVGDGSTPGGVPVTANFRSIEWEFNSVEGQTVYNRLNSSASKVDFPISSSGVFLVFYGTSKIKKSDYTLTSSTLTFKTAPLESGLPITIVYIGV